MYEGFIENLEDNLSSIEAEYPLWRSHEAELKRELTSLEQRVVQDPETGVKVVEYSTKEEFGTREGTYESLQYRTANSIGVNLASLLGLSTDSIYYQGLPVIDQQKAISDHFDFFTENRNRMPVFVPSNVKETLDLRLGDEVSRESANSFPAKLFTQYFEPVDVFVHDFQDLINVFYTGDYKDFHEDKSHWEDHTDHRIARDTLLDVEYGDEYQFFAITHVYEKNDEGVFFPNSLPMTLINDVDNHFAEPYVNSDIDTNGSVSPFRSR